MSAQDRRIMTEMKQLKELYNEINVNIKNEIAEVTLQNPKQQKYPKVKFIMRGTYPFQPPLTYIYVNGKETSYKMFRIYCSFPRIINAIKIINIKTDKIVSTQCFCCDSILYDNWSPAITLDKVIDEINKTNYIKRQVKTLLELQNIGKKNKLSQDIELIIFDYLF